MTNPQSRPDDRTARRARWSDPDTIRAIIGLAVLACVLAILVGFSFNDAAQAWAKEAAKGHQAFWKFLSRLGQSDWLLVPSGVAVLAIHALRRPALERHGHDFGPLLERLLFFFLAIAVTGLVALAFKYSIGLPRPTVVDASGAQHFTLDYRYASFPSGHSTTVGSLAMTMTLLHPAIGTVFWLFALAVGWSRVMVGAHHVSDVLAGLSLGAWGTVLLAQAFARRGAVFELTAAGWPRRKRRAMDALLADGRTVLALLKWRRAAEKAASRAEAAADMGRGMITQGPSEPGFVSVVIPAKDEAENLAVIIPEILTAMAGRRFEIIVVDDGSTDGTGALLSSLMAAGEPVRHIRHALPCGQSAAVRSGMQAARGEIVATIDGDGQNDPAYIPQLVDALVLAGLDYGIAAGQRLKRTDGLAKTYASRFANWLRNSILDDRTRDTGCGLKAVRRDIFLRLPFFHGWHRYLPALVLREGFDVVHLDVVDRSRIHGKSNYGIFDRGLQGVLDLFGVWWLKRRIKRLPDASEIGGSR